MFEIRKNLDLRKIFVTPKIFLKSRFHCTPSGLSKISLGASRLWIYCKTPLEYFIQYTHATPIILSQYIYFQTYVHFCSNENNYVSCEWNCSSDSINTKIRHLRTAIPYRASTGPEQGFPCFSKQGDTFFHYRELLFSLQGFPCQKNFTGKNPVFIKGKGLQ